MNNRQNAGRRRKRITGRFYALLTLAVVFAVFAAAVAISRGRAPEPPTVQALNPAENEPSGTAEPSGGADPAEPSGTPAVTEIDENATPLTDEELARVTNLSVTQGLSGDWRNILLLGADKRGIQKVARTDTLIVASVNVKEGRVKLTSIMRDLIVPLPDDRNGNPRQGKINSVIYYGGPELVMKTVNELFGLNITEYALVNFASFQKIIDILGGIDIDITQAERDEINRSLGENAMASGTMTQEAYLAQKESLTLKAFGARTRLTGIQALGYARIRHIGDDYQRTERQRGVLTAMLKEIKSSANPIELMQIAGAMWGEFSTNINMLDAVGLASAVIQSGSAGIDGQARLPATGTYDDGTRNGISALWDCDFQENRRKLFRFIYET